MANISMLSKKGLDLSFRKAKKYCRSNLGKYVEGLSDINYDSFSYIIDNEMMGSDMGFKDFSGKIKVSIKKLMWFMNRETEMEEWQVARPYVSFEGGGKLTGAVEIDLESSFVHDITELSIYNSPEALNLCLSKNEDPHYIARLVENQNRKERNLRPWPEY